MLKRGWLSAILWLGLSLPALANTNQIQLEGNANFWWTIQEQVENGERQAGSGDPVAQEASGLAILRPCSASGWRSGPTSLTPGARSTPGPGWASTSAR